MELCLELHRKFGLYFKIIHNSFEKELNNSLAPLELTTAQLDVLTFISMNKDNKIFQKDIERVLHLKNPTVTGIIKRMISKGLIECLTDLDDHRYKRIYLTEKSKEALKNIEKYIKTIESKLLNGMSEEELNEFDRLLNISLINITQS